MNDSGPAKRKRDTKPKSGARKSRKATTEESVDISWPPYFKELEKVYRALNLVYTFCSTRKHLATTFENLKSAVESHTKKELTVEDIAQVKFLLPQSVQFAYVDEEKLLVHVMGDEAQDVYGGRNKDTKEVLLFEFLDGDLKKVKKSQSASSGRKNDLPAKMPAFSTAQMTKLITKRDQKFSAAVNAFLNECAQQGETDPVERIKSRYHLYVPAQAYTWAFSVSGGGGVPQEIPQERKSISEIVQEIKEADFYAGQVVPNGHRVFPPQEAVYGDLKFRLSQALVNALYTAHNITRLYSHQAEAINNLHDGHHVIVSTSTSSGKSLIYQIPVLHEMEKDRNARAMFIFPTKALAQDQRRSLVEVLEYMTDVLGDVRVDAFDGDTAMDARGQIRDEASVVFTNPDMLHLNILPNEGRWRFFLRNLRYVVVDELHVYNGFFGSHVGFIMRRLRRICASLGNEQVKFVSCSATVANPEAHMRTIFGIDSVKLTDGDGSPAGRKEFICWNSPYKDPGDPSSGRVDPISEGARLFVQLILRGVRAIAFCKLRQVCELVLSAVKSELERLERPEVIPRVMAYRGGYTAQDRRRIEKEMFEGRLLGIVATSALELGVDIGSLDAVVTIGFPYSISNLRQQSGRAGRRNKDSLSVLVGDAYPTDQYYMNNPDEIFTKPNVQLQVDLENILVREGHLQCAAFEIPIKPQEDAKYFGEDLPELARERLKYSGLGFYHCHDRFQPYPSKHVAIRDTEDNHIAVIDITRGRNVVLEEIEPSRAMFTIYEGGVFLHQGYTYLVKDVNPDLKLAKVELVKVDWTTSTRDFTDVDPIETQAIRSIPGSPYKAFYGPIRIQTVVFGFFKMDKRKRVLDAVEVDSPPLVIFSKGMWLDVPTSALDILRSKNLNLAAAIHAAEHALLSLLPNFVTSMPGDVKTECKAPEKEFMKRETARKRPARLTFYDAKGAGGTTTKAFEFVDLLLRQAVERVELCACLGGCVECVASERCKEMNAVLSKAGAYVVLRALLGLEIDLDKVPDGLLEEGGGAPVGVETVVPALEVQPRGGNKVEVIEVRRDNPGS